MADTFDPKQGPLHGLRILDMATVVAAPFAATLCADLGAEVTKLELPDGSDALRSLAPVEPGHALYWKVLNRGKRGITLDVRTDSGRALFLRLVAGMDVLVENFRPGTLDRWGLDLATLHRANPRLIVLRLTGFGQTGPYAGRPGFARIFEAMGGLAHLTGEADGPPQHVNFPLGDSMAGLFGAFAIAAAAAERARCPDAPGREIDLSATEALLRVLEPLAVERERSGQARQRSGARATYTAPSNIYRTKDGDWITLVGSSDAIFRRLCAAMQAPDMAADPRFATNPLRVRHLDALDGRVAAWCAAHSHDELRAALDAHAVPFCKVYDIDDVLADPHFAARGAIVRLPDADLGSVPAPAVVPRFGGHAPQPPRTGPAVGEHNAEVFGALGLTAEDLRGLRAAGAL
ncbi:CaiB/BaiF CoA-transferase family protein [Pseudacidovorax sp. RU35E]|uniref:CaiB/BaiF CoA transferase family protein n=1 Tax=Pseudacidovorax sp. RU35E TaxID=1907403 RepID=UPI000956993C|nr:CoA transferase [Pseudacidovorax sp. RU35E]SIQ92171.1 Crotonobetainyl-CoA:carnitine CoA-transferase CaiB [Pseudacidovorax sp. RU35E]